MAIVCDECRKNNVEKNGSICEECKKQIEESKIDRSYMNEIYLPTELFDKFKKLHDQVDKTKPETMKAFAKYVKTLGTSFINHLTGKEINDPTPRVIIPKERTIDRIQKILNHNLSVYAAQNDMDTPEDLDDWTVHDMYSDDWEKTLYQYVDDITQMDMDDINIPPVIEKKEPVIEKEEPENPS